MPTPLVLATWPTTPTVDPVGDVDSPRTAVPPVLLVTPFTAIGVPPACCVSPRTAVPVLVNTTPCTPVRLPRPSTPVPLLTRNASPRTANESGTPAFEIKPDENVPTRPDTEPVALKFPVM